MTTDDLPEELVPAGTARALSEFRDHGLLWLINRTVFHPRGYAIGFEMDEVGAVTGWQIYGDGSEPWRYGDDVEEERLLAAVEEFFAMVRGL